jgi:two-component system, NarL family, sensor histidine kinase DevS
VPYTRVEDPAKLRRLMAAVLMITADVELADLLRHIVEEARELVDARYGALGVLNSSRTALEEFVTVGLTDEEEQAIGPRPTGRGVLGVLITDPRPLRLARLGEHPDSYGFPSNHPPMTSFLGVPLRVRDDVYGNLYLTDKAGGGTFTDEDEALAEALALAAGIAIHTARLHDQVRVLSVLDDRDRIARDLHDRAIQRIFAVGMTLQGVARLPDRVQMVDRIDKAVDELDATITEIRSAIFELGESSVPGGLRHAVVRLCEELGPMLGDRPRVSFSGPVDNVVPPQTADHMLAVIREGLTNAGKYAGATSYEVTIDVDDGIHLEIVDNGSGFDRDRLASSGLGLGNMGNRASKLGGSFEILSQLDEGTRIVWHVPIPEA